ncbi:hypothetical protein ACEWY4_022764 [Coilia grayii]|uniref:E3 ubiquitin/ISG15 ligase TRIM25-like n=1 Tax=Coilia grayii TaxID=363190 RepID=A0ABD1J2Q3_9TELE
MASVSVSHDEFNCSICLDLLKDPVTVPCGHSFCMNCITGCWDNEDQKGVYSCPQCRQTFTPRPALARNTLMAEMLEKLKKTEVQSEAEAPCYAGSDDVECDFCTGEKHKAIKSCLTCMGSYCEAHVQPHYEVACLRKHMIVSVTKIQDRICSQHNRIIEVFCRTDQKLICMLCSMDDHSGHKTVSTAAERIKKQRKLVEMKEDIPQQIQQREDEVEEVKQALKSLQVSAQEAVDETERIFTELISFMEQKRSEVTESIRAQERAEVSRAEGLLEQLEMEITKLKNEDAKIGQLQPIEDATEFLQAFQAHLTLSVTKDLPRVTFEPQFSFKDVMKSVSPDLKEKTKQFHQDILKVTGFMTGDEVTLKAPEYVTKECNYIGRRAYSRQDCGYGHSYEVTVSGVGVVTAITGPDTMAVNFPERPNWNGTSSQLDLIFTI